MRTKGHRREVYAKTVEARPSRFADPEVYSAWAERADNWAEQQRQEGGVPLVWGLPRAQSDNPQRRRGEEDSETPQHKNTNNI